ncbi:hypothetical protein NL676_020780 [Syzygium grande]|nr:hypothetical protein NL676_020780 [Syzygium grande]
MPDSSRAAGGVLGRNWGRRRVCPSAEHGEDTPTRARCTRPTTAASALLHTVAGICLKVDQIRSSEEGEIIGYVGTSGCLDRRLRYPDTGAEEAEKKANGTGPQSGHGRKAKEGEGMKATTVMFVNFTGRHCHEPRTEG